MSYQADGVEVGRLTFAEMLREYSDEADSPVLVYEHPRFWSTVIKRAPWLLTWWRARA